ncbi:MAG: hypothetical protein E6I61_16090 [Chloroflexi bacterium]|nr:MAG: hypothetical protein E6I61_16090 [Chloroflexota bacterium]
MTYRRLGLSISVIAAMVAAFGASPVSANAIPVINDSQLQALTTSQAGAEPLSTDRTVQHWFGTTTNPHNGLTYGYNMVGVDPSTGGSATIEADITPIIVNVGGRTFNGNNVVGPTLASPQFALNKYGMTPAATAAGSFPNAPALIRGPGGVLSQGDRKNSLQLEDATMRAQFNKTGSSGYHLILHPNVLPSVTINVPSNQGTLLQSGRGVVFADIDIGWWSSQINNIENSADPTHLPIYLTDNVLLFIGKNIFNCCVIGYHGTSPVGIGAGSGNTNGNGKVQTFAWASYVAPGIYARPDGGTYWALQDIHAVSHEISEWADDPFVNNTVEPWVTPTAPQYGCTGVLETGDPVVAIGFAMGTNTFEQGPNPNGTQSADGYYHPEDEAYLPWFMRTSPNTVSEPTQSTSTNIGRYTLMGDLNPFPGFRQPATGC